MNLMETLPYWISLPVAFFLILGATLALLGAVGLVQLQSFYDRLHAPTLGTSWGAAGILLASMILVSWADSRLVLHELVIGIFIIITTPVTLMFLGRAALHRDRIEGTPGIPGAVERSDIPVPPQPRKRGKDVEIDENPLPPPGGFADPEDAPGER